MRLVSWIWFWYVVTGFAMGVSLMCLMQWAKSKAISFKAYEWAGIILNQLIFMFLAQTFIASYQEMVPRAAWLSVVFLGLPMVIIGVLTMRSVKKRLN